MDRAFRIRKTIAEMLVDRGYQNNAILIDMFKTNFDELKKKYKLTNPNLELTNANGTEITIVAMKSADKFKKDNLIQLFGYAMELNKKKKKEDQEGIFMGTVVLLVFDTKITSTIEKERDILNSQGKKEGVFIETWLSENLEINISRSELNPKMRKISSEEVNELKKRYELQSLNELPKIRHTDPMAKYLGARTGMVLEIKRPSETTGITIGYRVVV